MAIAAKQNDRPSLTRRLYGGAAVEHAPIDLIDAPTGTVETVSRSEEVN